MKLEWIYLLHFDEPLHHAQHYLGTTEQLFRRLANHANGNGARLTEVLYEQGLHWQLSLAATRLPNTESARTIERLAKDQNGLDKYCPICNPKSFRVPRGTQQYDVDLLEFPITSQELRTL